MTKPDFQFAPMAECNTDHQRVAIERQHGQQVSPRHEVHMECGQNCDPGCTKHLIVMTPDRHLQEHEQIERSRRWETQQFR